tara:strand:- start:980 stop:1126 length:147 start_codon:yes stop_codon:yes gene_type:complete
MNQKFSSNNNIQNDELNLNNEEKDYENLITRLKAIKKNIVFLEKIIFR